MQTNLISAVGGVEKLPITQETRNQPQIADLNQTIAREYPNPGTSLDEIALFPKTQRWMKQYSIMPSQWNLSPEEASRITAAGIRISIYNTPASWLPLAASIEGGLKHLVVVDPAPLSSGIFTPQQMIASLLHEIGHVVNAPVPGFLNGDYMLHMIGVAEDEIFADDYARYCGFGNDLADALEVMMQTEPRTFNNEAVKYRIQRIRNNAQIYRNLLSPVDAQH
ncbi:hypothetical protein [Prosthecobacter sp.]|uniref:hypothetical protein n=1 Tax=Prosthecobacter sp. TaxID=1965333 RepID=UPI0037847A01